MRAIGSITTTITLAAALAAGGANAAVKDSAANGFTIENEQTVPVDPATAWKALTEDVDRWWPKDHTWWGAASTLSIDPRAGGCFCEIGRDGKQQAQHMSVSFVDPGKTLRLLGGLGPLQGMGVSGAMEFRLSPAKDGGTRIVLYYRAGGYGPDDLSKFVPVIDKVQALQLGGLADYLRKPRAAGAKAEEKRP
ncbi:SRPBCC family protein [Pseudomonas sp. CGJS7]|uniref:SRPBCC family protein n=1 Tax=Pseudomonas sp. CGJS7 TaxID=3109348 RepID=UPI003008BAE1